MTLLDDLFTQPVDFQRDRWGRPLIIPPDGGKAVPYKRPSSFGDRIEDKFQIQQWEKRCLVVGMSHTPSLVAETVAIEANPKAWTKDDKSKLNDIADRAKVAARANEAADIGTALHRITERYDLGHDMGKLPEPFASDLAAYIEGMTAHDLVIRREWIECRMVCDELRTAGTTDRIVEMVKTIDDKAIYDLKTGATIDYSMLTYAIQLAIYSRSVLYNITTGERTPVPVRQDVAYIGHLPAGKGTFELYEVDINAGWEAAQLCADIDRWRARKDFFTHIPTPIHSLSRVDTVEGETLTEVDFDEVRKMLAALPDTGKQWVMRLKEEAKAKTGIWPKEGTADHPVYRYTSRRQAIMSALCNLAAAEVDDDDTVKAIARHVTGDDACAWPSVTAGHAVGSLDVVQAKAFRDTALVFASGMGVLEFDQLGAKVAA
jgi:hypothetical protein